MDSKAVLIETDHNCKGLINLLQIVMISWQRFVSQEAMSG
jgi:hypothetical protein